MKAWICAALALIGFALFMVFIGWPAIIEAAEDDARMRHMRRVMIGISNTDRRCLEWAERNDNAWVCVRR